MSDVSAGVARQIEDGACTLGIEYGSTRIKAVLNDEADTPIAVGGHDWENSFDGTYWTYAEDELVSGIQGAYAALKADVAARYGVTLRRLGALGVSAMMHGYLPLSADGRLLVPFRTWRNTTTSRAASELSRAFAFHVPERWSCSHLYQAVLDGEGHVGRVAWLTTLAGYAHWRLTGERCLSVGDASGMFPIDVATCSYDRAKIQTFDELVAAHGVRWKVEDLLPRVLVAGQVAGHLTSAGAALLDPSGELEAGCPVCPPEGDAGTGMIATNSVAPRTGNVSAGTSVFSMVVLDRPLPDATSPAIDLVTTPVGDPVAMVHCNNCTSDINAWMGLLSSYSALMGIPVDSGELYGRLFEAAYAADKDAAGLVSLPFVSGEPVVGVDVGHPLFARGTNAHLDVGSFMRAQLMGAFAALALGNGALREQGVRIERIYAHGGIFKTPRVAQSMLAAALEAPVSVMATAGEGGAWGQAVAASYMLRRGEGESLADFLDNRVFVGMEALTLEPDPDDVAGYRSYLARFRHALEAERAL